MGPVWAVFAFGATLRGVDWNGEGLPLFWGRGKNDVAAGVGATSEGPEVGAEIGGKNVELPGEGLLEEVDLSSPRKEKMPP